MNTLPEFEDSYLTFVGMCAQLNIMCGEFSQHKQKQLLSMVGSDDDVEAVPDLSITLSPFMSLQFYKDILPVVMHAYQLGRAINKDDLSPYRNLLTLSYPHELLGFDDREEYDAQDVLDVTKQLTNAVYNSLDEIGFINPSFVVLAQKMRTALQKLFEYFPGFVYHNSKQYNAATSMIYWSAFFTREEFTEYMSDLYSFRTKNLRENTAEILYDIDPALHEELIDDYEEQITSFVEYALNKIYTLRLVPC